MILPDIKALVRGKATFLRAQDEALWYQVEYALNADASAKAIFEFPIPYEETNGAVFAPTESALIMMRWIRRRLDYWRQVEIARAHEVEGE